MSDWLYNESLPQQTKEEVVPVDEIIEDAKRGVSPWIQRAWLIALSLSIFIFLVSIKLDHDLPGSWWAVFSPLYVLQGIFGILVFLYFIRIRFIFKQGIRIDVPAEATIYQAIIETILIVVAFATESLIIVKITGNDSYGWAIAFIPMYVMGGILLGYYTVATIQPKWFTSTAHFNKHSLDKWIAYTRGMAVAFILIFLILLNLRLDGVWHISMWLVLLPWIGVVIIAIRWIYEYLVTPEAREFTGLEFIGIVSVVLPFLFGIVFLCGRLDHWTDWSWFATLSPLTFGFLILFFLFVIWIYVAHKINSKRQISRNLFEEGVITKDMEKKCNFFDDPDDQDSDEETNGL